MTKFVFKNIRGPGGVIDTAARTVPIDFEPPLGLERADTLEQVGKLSLKDQLFAHTGQAIRFLQANDLVPPLPPQLDVVFTGVSLAEHLANRAKRLVGQQEAPQYWHLACCDPATSTVYVSSSYLTNSKQYRDFSEALGVLDVEFGGDIRKVIERDLFHELGHLALREKFKHMKPADSGSDLYARMKANIEEGFADSFSFHLMCIKHPDKQQFAASESYFKECSDLLKTYEVGPADVYRIFSMLPFVTNGVVVTNVGEIVDRCWAAALQNNKDMLLEKMTADPYFTQDVMKAMNTSNSQPQTLVAQFHKQVINEGFDARKILSVRTLYAPSKREDQLRLK
jgi:hypothetical protein